MMYYSIEPWGSQVEGYRDALSCATVANAGLFTSAPKLLKSNPFQPKDFLVQPTGASKQPAEKKTNNFNLLKLNMENNMFTHNKGLRDQNKSLRDQK